MQPRTPKHLEDVQLAAAFILEITTGRSELDYKSDKILRSTVERQFEIIGEALNRVSREDPETLGLITNAAQIISFRNLLIHGYDLVDDARVWSVVERGLPLLAKEVSELLLEP
jgi:uncharacterized protein with HEPN domain